MSVIDLKLYCQDIGEGHVSRVKKVRMSLVEIRSNELIAIVSIF